MVETMNISLMEAIAEGLQKGNSTIIPLDFIIAIAKSFDTVPMSIESFDVEIENNEYKSIKINFKKES